MAIGWPHLVNASGDRSGAQKEAGYEAKIRPREFACHGDMSLTNYVADLLQDKTPTRPGGMTDGEIAQISAAVTILKGEQNSHLSVQEKYQAILDLCVEGRILKKRFGTLPEKAE